MIKISTIIEKLIGGRRNVSSDIPNGGMGVPSDTANPDDISPASVGGNSDGFHEDRASETHDAGGCDALSPNGICSPFSPRSFVVSALLVFAVGFCAAVTVQLLSKGYVSIAGYSAFRVVTGSMEPTISVGEALICRKTPIEDIEIGDIICYRSELEVIRGSIVTHRVTDIAADTEGRLYLTTRGDANLSSDPYTVDSSGLVGRVIWHSGEESFLTDSLTFLTGRVGFLACIVFPVLLIVGLILQRAVNNLYREIREMGRAIAASRADEAAKTANEAPIPGYTTLTEKDYAEITEMIRAELLKEQYEHISEDSESHDDSN